jgi:hypothetical protein
MKQLRKPAAVIAALILVTQLCLSMPFAAATASAATATTATAEPWYSGYVTYLTGKGIDLNAKDSRFDPDAAVTRAAFVGVLYRLSGETLGTNYPAISFTDVSASSESFEAVQWALVRGIALGSDGRFEPEAAVTREQMLALLYRYAKYKGLDVSNIEGMALREYSDYLEISSWALTPVRWALNLGLISGNGDRTLRAPFAATQAEEAKVLALFLQKTGL